ncbi:MAG TPA: TraB/GumN family protein [Candidatus Limnocylindrales bacterium]|nr:TraB/GumN family protein [Candidatus Limnocylindrales bacterium]
MSIHLRAPVWIGLVLVVSALGLCAGELRGQEKSFLWQIESGKNRVYILGSIHLRRQADGPLKPIIDETFAKAKRLVFEVDLLNDEPEKMQQMVLKRGINPDGKTLQQTISQETFQSATLWANALGIDIKVLSPFKPWVAGMTMVAMQLQKLGYDPNLGVDRLLAARAKQTNKSVSGLESADFQINLLDNLPAGLQETMLRESFAEMAQLEKTVEAMVRAWRDGDLAAAEKLFLESMAEYPELREKLIDERNRNWLPQIEKFINDGEDTLVVVGAAHLVGKNGVIELLKGRGYKVEQM